MKKLNQIALILVMSFSVTIACAQQDTLVITEEYEAEQVDYLSPLEYAFMMHEETPWMFKFGFPAGRNELPSARSIQLPANVQANTNLSVGFERKIGDALSLNMAFELLSFDDYSGIGNFVIAPRWYYQMKKRMRDKNLKSNLSGNYFSAGLKYQNNSGQGNFYTFFGEWGMQRRFLKSGYIDFAFQAGYVSSLKSDQNEIFSAGTRVNVGLVWAKDRQSFDESKICDIFKCYESKNRLIKFNLSNVINTAFFKSQRSIKATIDVGFEQKIGETPFSVAIQFIGSFIHIKNRFNFSSDTYGLISSIGPRYYYNLRRRIAKGKSGNGLSANYVTVNFSNISYRSNEKILFEPITIIRNRQSLDFMVGFQRTISDHLYYDVRVGIGTFLDDSKNITEDNFRLPIAIGVGFRL